MNVIARFPTFFPVAMRYTSMISALFFGLQRRDLRPLEQELMYLLLH